MTARPLAAVVLAAGQGKRMKASVPKVLLDVCGRALVEHVLEAARPLGARPTVVVYGHGGEAVQRALQGRDLAFAHQPEQRGTGHAVQCALPALGDFAGDVLVLCGDTPLLTSAVLEGLVADHRSEERTLTVLTAELREPGSLGRILRDRRGKLAAIREAADATREELAVREINTGVMVIEAQRLRDSLARLTADNAQGEYYLTDLPGLFLADGLRVAAHRAEDPGAAHGVNRPAELAEAARRLRRRLLAAALRDGVRVADPESTVLDAGVEIGVGTVLLPFTYLARDVRIGKDCRIGPHAHLAEGVVVGDRAVLGSHVEVRRGTVEEGARVAGPARLVDVAVGRDARVGPGVVADGGGRVVIGDRADVGARVVLVGPATVGEGARVEPGTVLKPAGRPAGVEQDA